MATMLAPATPSTTDELTSMSATQLAGHIARGDIRAADVVEAHIVRIERVNGQLNAVVFERFEAARAEARAADQRLKAGEAPGPLHGVPITIKDSIDVAGAPTTFGLPSRAGHRAARDERHVARLRDAGAIVLGKTNVAQLLMYYESDNPLYGRANNPWNSARTPGGSSGGEAAIVAAGGAALGLGTDIGGSVRIPAHFCGIASMKPTAGRTPDLGRYSVPLGQHAVPSQVGVLARHVEDVALGLDVINGGREPAMPLGDLREVDIGKLRIACYTDDGTFAAAPAVARAVREAADMLRARGAQVVQWAPPRAAHGMDLLYGVFAADGGAWMRALIGKDPRTPPNAQLMQAAGMPRWLIRGLGALLNAAGQRGMASGIRAFGYRDTAHYWRLAEQIFEYQAAFAEALDRDAGGPFDAILCPVCPLPAFTHGRSRELLTAGAYACLYNTLGYPAGVVPVTRVHDGEQVGRGASRDMVERAALEVEQNSAGLPIGVQVVARPWREHVALAAMQAIEQAARTRADFPHTPLDPA
jgi:fatty acid amide hydrolase